MSTWVLLRGLAREKRHWHAFPNQLMRELPNARVVDLDLPGNGELKHLTSPLSIEGMASHCRDQLATLGIPPPYFLLGMSMGAMVATAWAVKHPGEVEACVLINTSFSTFSPVHQRLRPRAWLALLQFLLTSSATKREQLIFDLTTRLVAPSAPVVEAWVAIRRSRPVQTWNGLRQLIAAVRFHAPLNPPVKTLVLTSAGDRLVNPGCSMHIARQWHCAIAIHPAAGHDLPLDDGDWVVKELHDWIAGIEPSPKDR